MAINPKELRDAFGSFMTVVTIVTTVTADGEPIGFTANSFSSVSLDPPLLLVSIACTSGNFENFTGAERFAVNILAEAQTEASNTFARRHPDRFASVTWSSSARGNPVLEDVSAWFDCTMHKVVEAGDHAILIGLVEDFHAAGRPGLGYYRGGYFTPAKIASEVIADAKMLISAIIAHENRVLLVAAPSGGYTLPTVATGNEGADAALERIFARYQRGASANFVYSVYTDTRTQQQFVAFLCSTPYASATDGIYVELKDVPGLDIPDAAIKSMLQRYCRERELKTYGTYYGDHTHGVVKELIGRES
ncbi:MULTISPECIES: flavin reductase family protein [Xanthomonas]|uniref:Flavin reductase family protein n=1 Tax=Xanthomonas cucurbitae TaxID=56453 RepID=A0ABY7YA81_9XANT|nr:flavin reductase family protein [Xanthomonas cucurbitae]QHG88046.1 flavin reductase [Xanthomonas cucurbitae]WDM66908.1 flavin reductase family protein [Xanthomonas cucurbitae]WDM70785.1 flavin reductase family protein [Xanthomonas cucurbitae]WDM74602.1 flavin reductase family protein [Xanthomonas cucurbitae]